MKKKLLALALVLATVLTFGLVACGGSDKPGDVTYYAGVHTIYLGEAHVVVDKDGKITTITLDEYFLPHAYATKSDAWAEKVPAGDLVGTTAKYIQIGKATFELEVADGAAKTFPAYAIARTAANNVAIYKQTNDEKVPGSVGKVTNLSQLLLTNQKAAKWYVAEVNKADGFKVLKADKSATGVTAKDYTYGIKKTEGKYGADPEHFFAWKKNVDATVATFKANPELYAQSFAKGTDTIQFDIPGGGKTTANTQFESGTVKSGATYSDFKDYWTILSIAYHQAIASL